MTAGAAGASPLPIATEFRSFTGRGVEAAVDGAVVAVGGPALLRERSLVEPAGDRARELDEWRARGASISSWCATTRCMGAIALEDEIRPESAGRDRRELHRRGVRAVMITGDAQQVADSVGARARRRRGVRGGAPRRQGARRSRSCRHAA